MDWSPEYFKKLATPHGAYVVSYVEQMIHQAEYPETAYKRSMGIIQLHRQYGSERLNNACRRALLADSLSYKTIWIKKTSMKRISLKPLHISHCTKTYVALKIMYNNLKLQ